MGMGDLSRLEKRKDYGPLDEVSQEDGKLDLKYGWPRMWYAFLFFWHVNTDQWVNLVRAMGCSDRNKSQKRGRFLMGCQIIIMVAPLAAFIRWLLA